MTIKSIALVLGCAATAALLVANFDQTLGITTFFGVAASMGFGEYLEHRRLRKVAAHLAKSEACLTDVLQVLERTLAEAKAIGDRNLIEKASLSLGSTQNVLNDIRELKTQVA